MLGCQRASRLNSQHLGYAVNGSARLVKKRSGAISLHATTRCGLAALSDRGTNIAGAGRCGGGPAGFALRRSDAESNLSRFRPVDPADRRPGRAWPLNRLVPTVRESGAADQSVYRRQGLGCRTASGNEEGPHGESITVGDKRRLPLSEIG